MASLFVDWLLDGPFQTLCEIARTAGHRDYGSPITNACRRSESAEPGLVASVATARARSERDRH